MGYRWFDEKQVEPLWPFGFGLSYTSFTLSNIHLTGRLRASSASEVTIHTTVKNTGRHDGHEVVQVYASPSVFIRKEGLQSYPKTLVGFTKVWVPAQESRDAKIVIKNEEFQWYCERDGSWRIDIGMYSLFVGTSIRDIASQLKVEIA